MGRAVLVLERTGMVAGDETIGFTDAVNCMSSKFKARCEANQRVTGCATMAGELGATEMNVKMEIKTERSRIRNDGSPPNTNALVFGFSFLFESTENI